MKGNMRKKWLSAFLAMVMLLSSAMAGNPLVLPVKAAGNEITATVRRAGSNIGGVVVELNCDVYGAEIYYTTNGSEPGTTHSGATKRYAGAIGLLASATVKAIAVKNGAKLADSDFSASYTISLTGLIPANTHPRVFFQAADVPALAARKDDPSGTFQVDYASGGFSDNWSAGQSPNNITAASTAYTGNGSVTGNNTSLVSAIEANALMYAMDKTTYAAQGARAKELTVAYATSFAANLGKNYSRQSNAIMIAFGKAYDWCYDLFSEAELTTIRNKIYAIARDTETGFPANGTPLATALLTYGQDAVSGHGREEGLLYAQLLCGIAMYDEDTNVPKMFDAAYARIITDYVPAGAAFFESATNMQGAGYAMRVEYDMIAIKILEAIGQPNPYNTTNMAEYFKRMLVFNRRPDGPVMTEGDDYWKYTYGRNWYWHYDRIYVAMMASITDDPIIQEEANRTLISFGDVSEAILDYLIRDKNAGNGRTDKYGASTTTELPLTAYWGGYFPSMTARTGWYNTRTIDPAPGVAIATMRMQQFNVGNHQHQDVGSFQLYYNGMLAMDSGSYDGYDTLHDFNYHKRSIAHNTVTVFDPAEKFLYYSTEYSNDGGQRFPYNLREMRTIDQMVDPANGLEISKVLGYGFGGGSNPDKAPIYSYLSGDLDKAYSSKVSAYKRSMVFLNLEAAGVTGGDVPAAFLVYDTLASSNADFRKAWLLHSEEEPDIAGSRTTIERNTREAVTGSSPQPAIEYDGKLVNDTLLPDAPVITKIGGAGKEFMVNGVNYPATGSNGPKPANSDTYGQWRIEVSPPAAAKSDEFLNVMQMMDLDGTPLATTKLTPNSGELVGANVANIDVYFGKATAAVSHAVSVTASAGASHLLITGLAQGEWTIGGSGSGTKQVTEEAGTLYMTVTPGETYTISPTGVEAEPLILSYALANSLLVAGKIAGSITLNGYNFTGGELFFVNESNVATQATTTSVDDTEIVATIPTGLAAGDYKLRVTAGGKSAEYAETITVNAGTIPADDGNLIKDGSFEQASSTGVWKINRNWLANSLTFSSDNPKDGNVSAVFVQDAAKHNMNGITQDLKAALMESGSGTYELSGWVRATDIPVSASWANFRITLALSINQTDSNRNDGNFTMSTEYYYGDNAAVEDTGWVYLTTKGFIDCSGLTDDAGTTAGFYTANAFDTGNNRQAGTLYFDGLSLRKIVSGVDDVIPSAALKEGELSGKALTITGMNFEATGMEIKLVDYKTGADLTAALPYTFVDAGKITVNVPTDLAAGAYKASVSKSGDTAVSKGAFHVMPATPVAIDADELLLDPGMELGTNANWQGGHSTATKPSYDSRTGIFAMELDNTGQADWRGIGQTVQSVFDLYGSGQYVVSAWVKNLTAPQSGGLALQIDHNGNYSNAQGGITALDTWTQISYTANIYAYEPITGGGFNVNNGNLYLVDDASMKRVPHTVTEVTGTTEIGSQITITGTNLSSKSKVFLVPASGPAIEATDLAYVKTGGADSLVVTSVKAVLPDTLTVGTEYTVRIVIGSSNAETGGLRADAAEKITVTAAAAEKADAAFNTAAHNFGSKAVGYDALTPQSFTITNTGDLPLTNLVLAITGSDFTLTQPAADTLAVGASATFTVVPKVGLKPGAGSASADFTADVTVTADEGVIAAVLEVKLTTTNTFTAAFTQNPYTIAPQAEGYAAADSVEVVMVATGTGGVDNVVVTPSGDTASFTIATLPLPSGGLKGTAYDATSWYPASRSITVTPVAGLTEGTYTLTLTLAASKSVAASTTVSFTVTENAPEALTGTLTVTGDAKFGATLTAVMDGAQGDATLTYAWKRGSDLIAGATGTTYVLKAEDIGKTITAVATAGSYTGSVESNGIADVAKADAPAAPSAPTLVSAAAEVITLNTIAGAEYSISGSGSWQASPIFAGLTADTSYSFVARIAETATALASAESAALDTSTAAAAKAVTTIAISSTSHKTAYTVGDALDVSSLTIEVTYDDGSDETINVTTGMVSGFDSSSAAAVVTLTVTYEGQTADYDISVAAPITVTGIAVNSTAHKTAYNTGDALDVTGLTIAVTYSDATSVTVNVTAGMVSGFDSAAAADALALTIAYMGKTTAFDVTVTAAQPQRPTPPPIVVQTPSPSATARPTATPAPTPAATPEATQAPEEPAIVSITTPDGQEPVQNEDGSQTLPNGGEITLAGEETVKAPEGTSITPDGTIIIGEAGGEVTAANGTVINVPGGSEIAGGVIAVGEGGATLVRVDSEEEIFIPEGVLFFLDEETPLGFTVLALPYVDVPAGAWFFEAATFACFENIMGSTSENEMVFGANAAAARSLIVEMLYSLSGKPETGGSTFKDVPASAAFANATAWAQENRVVFGFGDGLFKPDATITRQDFVVILMRYAAYAGLTIPELRESNTFADDASAAGYAKAAIDALYRAGVINGKPGNLFDPAKPATRAEVAMMLYKFMEVAK